MLLPQHLYQMLIGAVVTEFNRITSHRDVALVMEWDLGRWKIRKYLEGDCLKNFL